MPAFRKSYASKTALLPYLKSASSKLNLSALGSTSSLSAFFSSGHSGASSGANSGAASRSVVMNGIRGILSGREKENAVPRPAQQPQSRTKTKASSTAQVVAEAQSSEKKRQGAGTGAGAYPEISAPQLSPEALAAVKARFTLIPLARVDVAMQMVVDADSDADANAEADMDFGEDSFVHVRPAPVPPA
ncbi:hypothetical protein M0805_007694 [Coniferiporia weirii]|nr:hypothetical protein M0805_007694 [Coniferiporia weirii]